MSTGGLMLKRRRPLIIRPSPSDLADMEREIATIRRRQMVGMRRRYHVSRPTSGDADVRRLEAFLTEFRRTRIALMPRVDATNLLSHFVEARLAIPPDVKVLSQRYDFYLLRLGVNFHLVGPKPRQIVLGAEIDGGMADRSRSTVYSVFPRDRWKARLTGQYTMAFDADFTLSSPEQYAAGARIKLANKLWIKTAEFMWSKCVVKAQGVGSSQVSWRFRGIEPVRDGGDLPALAVLKVPKGRKRLIADATAVAFFRWLPWKDKTLGAVARYNVPLA
jgi:hypothetical protein